MTGISEESTGTGGEPRDTAADTGTGYRRVHFPSLPGPDTGILAVGVEGNNTVCLVNGPDAYLSGPLGNLRDAQSFDRFRQAIGKLQAEIGVRPAVIAHDMNTGCLAAKYARRLGAGKFVPVQQHFAHVAGVMAGQSETGRVLGVAYDDGGYGDDGTIWGAEFISATPAGYERLGHMRHLRWPGGSRAVTEPWRIAMAAIHVSYGYHTRDIAHEIFSDVPRDKLDKVFEMLEKGYHFPVGSSMGAYFAALAAMTGACVTGNTDGNAAGELEVLADGFVLEESVEPYPYDILDDGNLLLVDPTRVVYDIVENILAGKTPQQIAARFIETVAVITRDSCLRLRERAGTDKIVLAGATFKSGLLGQRTAGMMEKEGFTVLTLDTVPPDGSGISLGQAYVARAHQGGAASSDREGER